jgi:peptide chain release factor
MIRLLVTSGRGPAECRIAVARALDAISREATAAGLAIDVASGEAPDAHGPASAIVRIEGDGAEAFCGRWIGSALWVAASPIRPHHRRKNWYVGAFRLEAPPPIPALRPEDVRFETFRAGGPGGQHQNVTDSAVRALHLPSGIAVAVRSERSQHRNKAEAVARLAAALADRAELRRLESDKNARAAHEKLERGGAARRL